MKNSLRIIGLAFVLTSVLVLFSGCRQSDRVSYNVSKEADSFNITRKLTVMNVRSDKILMELTGTFSITNNSANELEVICRTGPDEYKKHFVYLNEWTVYTVEDISGAEIDPYKYELIFNPNMILPITVDVQPQEKGEPQ